MRSWANRGQRTAILHFVDLLILALELSDTLILADSVCPLSRAVMEIRIYIFDPIGPTN